MRWNLEHRLDEDERRSPEGSYRDTGVPRSRLQESTSSITNHDKKHETVTRYSSVHGWEFSAAKGDVSCTVLHGRKLQRDLWVLPVQDLAAALNAAPGEIMKLKKAVVEAPVEWYLSISFVLDAHGWRRLKSDPCCWILIDPDLVKTDNTQRVTTRSE